MGNKTSLNSIDPGEVANLPRKGLITKCRVVNVHDGDTITIMYMLAKNTPFKINLRMEGIDAPEITSKNQLEKDAGESVTRWLRFVLSRQKYWWVVPKKWDKYGGRVIGTLYSNVKQTESSINERMTDEGLVVPYHGGRKEGWSDDMLEEIIEMIKDSMNSKV